MIALSKNDFTEFNLNSKLKLIKKDGKLVSTRLSAQNIYSYYNLYGFHVEVVYSEKIGDITSVELLKYFNFGSFINSSLFDSQ